MVNVGSDLAADDNFLHPAMPISTQAHVGIAQSVERLHHVLTCLQRERRHTPAIYLELLRSALIGASTAIWLTHPSGPKERRQRSAGLAITEIREQLTVCRDIAAINTVGANNAATALGELNARLNDAIGAAERAGITNASDRKRRWPTTTEIIEHAANAAYPQPDEQLLRNTLAVLWRMHSGIAHARTEARFRHLKPDQIVTDGNNHFARPTPGLDEVYLSISALILLTQVAFSLLNQRNAVESSEPGGEPRP